MTRKIFTAVIVLVIVILLVISARGVLETVPYYSDAVCWAYEQGITNGTSATTFSPDRHITRAEVVTMLWRMAGRPETTGTIPFVDVETRPPAATPTTHVTPEPTPTPTPDPTPEPTPRVTPRPPTPHPTVHPEYALDYYGRMYIGDIYSVGLYDTMDQKLVDMTDAAFIAKFEDGCYMVGDHDSEGLWIIRWLEMGDTMKIVRKDGTVENYVLQYDDPHVTNTGVDVIDSMGRSCLKLGYDLMISTCNDSTGRDMTATFWTRLDDGDSAQIEAAPDVSIPLCGR